MTLLKLLFSGEMMMSILWYYRLEHTGTDPLPKYVDCEVFASRHRDVVPVACIEDICYVLTLGEFNRFVYFIEVFTKLFTNLVNAVSFHGMFSFERCLAYSGL